MVNYKIIGAVVLCLVVAGSIFYFFNVRREVSVEDFKLYIPIRCGTDYKLAGYFDHDFNDGFTRSWENDTENKGEVKVYDKNTFTIFLTPENTEVVAVMPGRVTGFLNFPGGDVVQVKTVQVKTGEFTTLYGKLKTKNVKKGQKVKAGQVLGIAAEKSKESPLPEIKELNSVVMIGLKTGGPVDIYGSRERGWENYWADRSPACFE